MPSAFAGCCLDLRMAGERKRNRDLRDRSRFLLGFAGQAFKAMDRHPEAIWSLVLTAFGGLGIALEGRPDNAMLFAFGTAAVLMRWER